MPNIYEVLNDDDFLAELRTNNELLIAFLTIENLEVVVEMVIKEPRFNDSPERCFRYPFVATEALCVDNEHIIKSLFEDPDCKLLHKLMSFVKVDEDTQLNSTLCGYFNKILSFWIIKKPNEMIKFI